eukprot:CAMPEP_0113299012 /NCGR_PEP_ID=MMETSP0010_2-20120614/1217_1 /TAXON_ID=216773 ORGANISM="Corethron hystrix, Strain 308" /NCGR_SAMPLE_ID=MMETSP0010_2 /ASSEMBLY_ACC=CAM_ASM_000155 /LENGTH=1296 /DNA_ID=CAMNT_0000152161 /DNA_START=261 /DNA_END=4151 /DNA_ORIENTATION=+ /assembly_acc=CAM_ASM_000155
MNGRKTCNSLPSKVMFEASRLNSQLHASTRSFTKTSIRSVLAVLNPGGTLTIQPMCALNLNFGDLNTSHARAYVKVRYGLETVTSEKVDAGVAPTWSHELSIKFKIESHKTSGVILLTVMGEREFKKDVELGTLVIPIAAALDCCNDIESKEDPTSDMYVRWFPLINSRNCVPVEGDMGLSGSPVDTEKTTDLEYRRFFSPCIKLGFKWEARPSCQRSPVHGNDMKSNLATDETKADTKVKRYLKAFVKEISASLVDSTRNQELFSLTVADIDVRYAMTDEKTRVGAVVNWIQIDHQLKGQLPVILSPTPVSYPQPTLQIYAAKDNVRSKPGLDSFLYISCQLQELDVNLEEEVLLNVLYFIANDARRKHVQKKLRESKETREHYVMDHIRKFAFSSENQNDEFNTQVDNLDSKEPNKRNSDGKRKVYVEQLNLGSVKLNLSYMKNSNQIEHYSVRMDGPVSDCDSVEVDRKIDEIFVRSSIDLYRWWSEQTNDEYLWREGEMADKFASLSSALVTLVPTITNAPIKLNGKVIEYVFESLDEIMASLKGYYVYETLRQLYKILGSIDSIGNPTMLLNSLGTGVRDFFYEPALALATSPMTLFPGFVKGTLSLVSNTTTGLTVTLSKYSHLLGHGLASATLDKGFKRQHAQRAASDAMNAKNSLKNITSSKEALKLTLRPFQVIVQGVVSGAVGVIYEPYKGCKKSGLKGASKGVLIGVTGVIVKPMVGLVDAAGHTFHAFSRIAKNINFLETRFVEVKKRRLPYVFGVDGRLLSFDYHYAKCFQLLQLFPSEYDDYNNTRGKGETLIITEVLQPESSIETYVAVTNIRVCVIEVRRDYNGSINTSMMWEMPISHALRSGLENKGHNGFTLHVWFENELNTCKSNNDEIGQAQQVNTGSSFDIMSKSSHGSNLDEINSKCTQNVFFFENAHKVENDPFYPFTEFAKNFGRRSKKITQKNVIVGDYRNKTQLVRLHNAICAVTSNFKYLAVNCSLGIKGSTVFGCLEFEEKNEMNKSVEQIPLSGVSDQLKKLGSSPWMKIEIKGVSQSIIDDDFSLGTFSTSFTLRNGKSDYWFNKALERAIEEIPRYDDVYETVNICPHNEKNFTKSGQARKIMEKTPLLQPKKNLTHDMKFGRRCKSLNLSESNQSLSETIDSTMDADTKSLHERIHTLENTLNAILGNNISVNNTFNSSSKPTALALKLFKPNQSLDLNCDVSALSVAGTSALIDLGELPSNDISAVQKATDDIAGRNQSDLVVDTSFPSHMSLKVRKEPGRFGRRYFSLSLKKRKGKNKFKTK